MTKLAAVMEATEIEKRLRELLGHDKVGVKPYGRHFLVQIEDETGPDTVARITRLDPRTWGAAFKSHTGRWDPLPDEGDRDEMIALVVDELGPYLDPANY
jgi:hypothetical protein